MTTGMDILVATRGASHSSLALELAVDLARQLDATLTVLTVSRNEAEREAGEAALDEAMRHVGSRLPEARYRSLHRIGHSAEEILDELESGPYDLAVLGEREHQTRLTRLVLGSTAERVIEHAPCAVAVAKGRVGPARRLLLCDSGVAEAPLVELLAEQLPALLHRAEAVTVLHVMSQMSAGPAAEAGDLSETAEDLMESQAPEGRVLARDVDRLAREGVAPHTVVRHGLVVDEVVAEAERGRADLVVIGANRGDGWRKVLLGDLTRDIFRDLHCPVLVMRPPSS